MSLTPSSYPTSNPEDNRIQGNLGLATPPFPHPSSYPAYRSASSQPTVLLAEDNDDLRETTTKVLQATGYRVIACADAQIASGAFLAQAPPGAVDLLLTDIEMPGRSGIELARELTALCPELPVLIVSGSLISADLTCEMQDRRWRFLGKPFRLPALLDTLRNLLAPARQSAT